MPMNQKTTSPMLAKPGRKVNPKMTTNRSMMIPTQQEPITGKKKSKKAKKPQRVVASQAVAPTSVPEFNSPAQPIQPQKRGGSNMTTNEVVGNKQTLQTIYNNLGKTIIQDELLGAEDKKQVCEIFIQDAGGVTPEILSFLNGNSENTLSEEFKIVENSLQSLYTLYAEKDSVTEEEKPKWEKKTKEMYAISEKGCNTIIETLNASFLPQEIKYKKFKELIILVNNHPFGSIPTMVHSKFYIFTVSIIKAGLFKILMEDFYPQQ